MNESDFEIKAWKILIFGNAGTGKTTAALSGEGRKAYMELDIGSLARAVEGSPIDRSLIDYHPYRLPATSLRERVRLSSERIGQSGKGAMTFISPLSGYADLMYQFTNDFCDFAEDPNVSDIIIDTGSLCWDLFLLGSREEVQKMTPPDQWKSDLNRLEYQRPNMMIWDICNWSQVNGKNLIFTSRETYQWAGNDYDYNNPKPDGSKHLPGYVDVVVRLSIKNRKPVGVLDKVAAGGLELTGMEIEYPTVANITRLLKTAAQMRRHGIPFPQPLTYQAMKALME
jgi:hypothetical protein